MTRKMEELEKVKDKRTLTKYEKGLLDEQRQYRDHLYARLREDAGLDKADAAGIADEYKSMSRFAEAVRKGVKFGFDGEEEQKLKLIGLSV